MSYLLVIDNPGRLGNRLQMCAHCLAYAIERGHSIALLGLDEYADHFQGASNDVWCRYPSRSSLLRPTQRRRDRCRRLTVKGSRFLSRWPWIGKLLRLEELRASREARVLLFDPVHDELIGSSRIVFMSGYYYFDPRSLVKQSERVREFFRPVARHRDVVEATIRNARSGCDVLVGVHVRRGDYLSFSGGKYLYTLEDYEQILMRMRSLFPRKTVHFLICSDQPLPEDAFPNVSWHPGPGTPLEDMYSLAECDWIIGPFSTFSRWSAFYGKVKRYVVEEPHTSFDLSSFQTEEHVGIPMDLRDRLAEI